MSKKRTLAIVGAGPNCVYVLERLLSSASSEIKPFELEVIVFEKSGIFGAGKVHNYLQPKSSVLNRIAGQVSFAADESCKSAKALLPKHERLNLCEWAKKEYIKNKNEDFNLSPEDWPKRYVHGLALKHHFEKYVDRLNKYPNVTVKLIQAEVFDVSSTLSDALQIDYRNDSGNASIVVDDILFATGHSSNDPEKSEKSNSYYRFAQKHKLHYLPSAYPLEDNVPLDEIDGSQVIGLDGMGLTSIDLVLLFTEGTGGKFTRDKNNELTYQRSGREPKLIVPFSEAGLFIFSRPFNAKQVNLDLYEHKGVFLKKSSIDFLRKTVGKEIFIEKRAVNQLDFEKHIWPLLLLEMNFLYYKTLYGEDFANYVQHYLYGNFNELYLSRYGDEPGKNVSLLLEGFYNLLNNVGRQIDFILNGDRLFRETVQDFSIPNPQNCLKKYCSVIFGDKGPYVWENIISVNTRFDKSANYAKTAFGHNLLAKDNAFNWDKTISPINLDGIANGKEYQDALLKFMERDHLSSNQNNLNNPFKATTDGVWRDLRSVLAFAVDFGGLNAESHRLFLEVYMRYHNRLVSGADVEIMEKILLLIKEKLVSLEMGPGTRVTLDENEKAFVLTGEKTGERMKVDWLIDAKVHTFDPSLDKSDLYANLLKKGFVKKWANPSGIGSPYEPGGLYLDENFHSINSQGVVDERLTFLGPPTEGVLFFQLGALRPDQDHHVMEDIVRWLESFWKKVTENTKVEANV